MKAKLITLALSAIIISGTAQAHYHHYQGYHSQPQLSTIAAVSKMYDDTPVTIKGKIIRSLGGEKYELQDATGTIRVEIDDDYGLPSQLVGRQVTISGDVDIKFGGRAEIDVDFLTIH